MFITKKHISRRTLLRGAGVALGLPLLDSMFPAATALAQAAAAPPRRFFAGFVPHGAAPGYWVPEKEGALPAELPFIWKPLEPYRRSLTVLTGLHSTSSEPPPGETGADHWVAAAFLCADKPKKTAGADVRAGQTIDQIIAEKIGRETLLPSVEMSVEDPGSGSSNCGEGYSCVYTNTIAWASPTTPLPMELNPQVVFERMFGSGSTPEQREARRERNQSILDSINGKIASLRDGDQRSGPVASRQLHRERPRDRAPAADRGQRHDSGARGFRGSARHSAVVRRAHQADVRPASSRVPGRPHARGHLALCARPHGAPLPGQRSSEFRFPWRLASRRGPRADRARCRRSISTT